MTLPDHRRLLATTALPLQAALLYEVVRKPRAWALRPHRKGGPGSALPSSQDNACGCTATGSRKCLGEARWPTAQQDKRSRQALGFSFQQSLNRGPKTRSKLAGSCGTLSGLVKETGSVEELPGRDEVERV